MDKDIRRIVKKILEPKKERKVDVKTLFYMKNSHKMADGTVMSGKTHTKNSRVIKKGTGKKAKKKSSY